MAWISATLLVTLFAINDLVLSAFTTACEQRARTAEAAKLNSSAYIVEQTGPEDATRTKITEVDLLIAGPNRRQRTFHFSDVILSRQDAISYDSKLNTIIERDRERVFINEARLEAVRTNVVRQEQREFRVEAYFDKLFLLREADPQRLDDRFLFTVGPQEVVPIRHRDLWFPQALKESGWSPGIIADNEWGMPPVGWFATPDLVKLTRRIPNTTVVDTLYIDPTLDASLVCRRLQLTPQVAFTVFFSEFEKFSPGGYFPRYVVWGLTGQRQFAEEIHTLDFGKETQPADFNYEFEPGTVIRDGQGNILESIPGGEGLIMKTVDAVLLQNKLATPLDRRPMYLVSWTDQALAFVSGLVISVTITGLAFRFWYRARLRRGTNNGIDHSKA